MTEGKRPENEQRINQNKLRLFEPEEKQCSGAFFLSLPDNNKSVKMNFPFAGWIINDKVLKVTEM